MISITHDSDGALVLFSGGQDSSTCLAWALDRFAQRRDRGLRLWPAPPRRARRAARPLRAGLARSIRAWAARLGDDHTLDLGALGQISETALTRDTAIEHRRPTACPTPSCPAATSCSSPSPRRWPIAAALRHIVGGMCETDYSGYPDCRDDTIKALQVALNLGMDRRFVLDTPLMWIDKAATWALAQDAGRRGAGRPDRRGDPHLLPRRPRAPPRLGLRLRHLPGL